MIRLLFVFLIVNQLSYSQENPLRAFNPLVNKSWKAEGKWGDGSKFKQQINFKYSLNKQIVIAESIGFVDEAQSELGLRNHGIRRYNPESGKINFWEFDVFGGLTEGEVIIKGDHIYYQYRYGNSTVTDGWEKIDDNTYHFKVGEYTEGQWKQLYLETQFIRVQAK